MYAMKMRVRAPGVNSKVGLEKTERRVGRRATWMETRRSWRGPRAAESFIVGDEGVWWWWFEAEMELGWNGWDFNLGSR